MVAPFSIDLRMRVAVALEQGDSVCAVAKRFGVSVASAVRVGQMHRSGLGQGHGKTGGHRRAKLKGETGDWLLARLAEKPDLTMRALTAELADRGVHVVHDTVWCSVRKAGQTVKKTLMASEPFRPKVARFRVRWKTHQHRLDPKRLIFRDETWIKTNMTRTCGWAEKGTRLTAHVPHGHWKTLTFLAGLRHDRIVAPFVLDGPINGDSFSARVAKCLMPTLAPGDIVIDGNLGSHKGQPARQLIRKAGSHLLFLPPYSPDLNPIEMVFSKLKTLFRKADERSIEAS